MTNQMTLCHATSYKTLKTNGENYINKINLLYLSLVKKTFASKVICLVCNPNKIDKFQILNHEVINDNLLIYRINNSFNQNSLRC